MKLALASTDNKFFYSKSERDAPTLYFSYLPSFAAQLKEHGKGVIYFGNTFVFGLVGTKDCKQLVADFETACKGSSTKPVKANVKDNVKFDFKIKGQKPVVTKDICQFNITGAGFSEEALVAILQKAGYVSMD